MKFSFSVVAPLLLGVITLGLNGLPSARGAGDGLTAEQSRSLQENEGIACGLRFMDQAVFMDLPSQGGPDNMEQEQIGAHMVYGCVSWNQIVNPMLSDDVISITGSGETVEIQFSDSCPIDERMLPLMFPQNGIIYVGFDIEPAFETDTKTPGVGFLMIPAPEHLQVVDDKVIITGTGVPFDMLFTDMVIEYDDEFEEVVDDGRRMEEEVMSTNTSTVAFPIQDGRELQSFNQRLNIVDTSASVGPFTLGVNVGVTVKGRAYLSHRMSNPCRATTRVCAPWPFNDRCRTVCTWRVPSLSVTAGAEIEVRADAGLTLTFEVSRSPDPFVREQSNPPRIPIPGVGQTVNIPGWVRAGLRAIGISVRPSYGIGLSVAAPWFVEITVELNAQFQTGATVGVSTGRKGFEATLSASFSGFSTTFRKTKDESPFFFSETPPLPSVNDVEAELSIEVFAGIKPQIILDVVGIATGAVGIKTGLSGTASLHNPPIFSDTVTGLLPFEIGECQNCHRIELGLAAVVRDPFFWYQFIGGSRREEAIADVNLAKELLRVCLWELPLMPVDECTPRSGPRPGPSPTPKRPSGPTAKQPTKKPTRGPTRRPTPGPTPKPSPRPTPKPSSPRPTPRPSTLKPTPRPTTPRPSPNPTPKAPSPDPSFRPSPNPTPKAPSPRPTPRGPTNRPTLRPSPSPTKKGATRKPTTRPTRRPTKKPTRKPTPQPTASSAPSSVPTFLVAPENDRCVDAQEITLGPSPIAGTTRGSTFDAVGSLFCGTPITSPGVWYSFVADQSCPGQMGLSVLASTCHMADFDTKISIFSGSCSGLSCVAGRDDTNGCNGNTQELEFDAVPGDRYFVLVHGGVTVNVSPFTVEFEVGDFELLLSCGSGSPFPTPSPTVTPPRPPTPPLPPTPGMMGDPHLMSFTGEFFDYMGACDLVLFHVPNFDGHGGDLTVHVRTTIRYDYSYIETAALRIGNDTLEVSAWGDYSFNDVEGALINSHARTGLGKTSAVPKIGGFPIFHTPRDEKNHFFDIVLPHHQNITISSMKDIVSVKIHHATPDFFGNVVGFLGNYSGHMLARDGVTDLHEDINKMGDEWQVRHNEPMLFANARAPQYPDKCRLPDMEAKESRRLGEGINEDEASKACSHLKKGNPRAFAACVYDVTATNDLEQAGAY